MLGTYSYTLRFLLPFPILSAVFHLAVRFRLLFRPLHSLSSTSFGSTIPSSIPFPTFFQHFPNLFYDSFFPSLHSLRSPSLGSTIPSSLPHSLSSSSFGSKIPSSLPPILSAVPHLALWFLLPFLPLSQQFLTWLQNYFVPSSHSLRSCPHSSTIPSILTFLLSGVPHLALRFLLLFPSRHSFSISPICFTIPSSLPSISICAGVPHLAHILPTVPPSSLGSTIPLSFPPFSQQFLLIWLYDPLLSFPPFSKQFLTWLYDSFFPSFHSFSNSSLGCLICTSNPKHLSSGTSSPHGMPTSPWGHALSATKRSISARISI